MLSFSKVDLKFTLCVYVVSLVCCGHIVVPAGVGFGLELVVISPCTTIDDGVRAS